MSERKSNFSVTCSLLSQFLKEKRSVGDLGVIDMASMHPERTKGIFRPPTTMRFLPGIDVSASDRNATKSMELSVHQTGFESSKQRTDTKEEERAHNQMTIFYAGKVLVYDKFPADKANDLMQLAAKGVSAAAPPTALALADGPPASCPSTSGSKPAPAPTQATPSDLPMTIARRTSLHRFFSKRKDRITSKAPYQVNSPSPSGAGDSAGKPEEARAWLGLGSEIASPSSTSENWS